MTTILIKKKDTAGAPAPGDLTNAAGGTEIAVNTATKRIYTKDSGGTVVELGTNPSAMTGNLLFSPDNTYDIGASGATRPRSLFLGTNITVGSLTSTRVPYASTGGLLVDSANMTFDGTKLTVAGLKDSALTSGRVTYATTSGELTDSANLTFDGTTLTANALTVSNAVTLSGGTANGVPYLNGSKVLTTGSALTFDGANLGVGIAVPLVRLHVATAGNTPIIAEVTSGATSYFNLRNTGGQAYIAANNNDLVFATTSSATEGMRLTSTGLGVGTSTIPTVGSTTVLAVGNSSGGTLGIVQSGSIAYRISASTSGVDCYNPNSSPISWYTAGTSRLTLDAAGNLGLGVTPQARLNVQYADSAPTASGTMASGVVFQYSAGGVALNMGSSSGGYVYFNSAYANNAGAGAAYRWYQGATQAMTLDASGQLVIGATSANSTLNVVGPQTTFDTNVFGQVLVRSTAAYNATPRAGIAFSVKYNSAGNYIAGGSSIQGYKQTAADGEFANGLLFTTQAEGSAPAERMRITSTGDLLVGTTTAGGVGLSLYATAGSIQTIFNNAQTSFTANSFRYNGTQIGSISTSTTATAYNTSSDYRLKDNITLMTGALAFVRKQRPVTYDWKADGSKGGGYIAHWLQEDGAGNCVTGEKDAVDKDGKPVYQGIDTSFMVAPLNAAINELADIVEAQAAIITQLKARLDAANL